MIQKIHIIKLMRPPLLSGLMNPRTEKIRLCRSIRNNSIPVPIKEERSIKFFGFLNTSLQTCFHPNSSIISSASTFLLYISISFLIALLRIKRTRNVIIKINIFALIRPIIVYFPDTY